MQKLAPKGKNRLDIDKTGLEYKKWKSGAAFPVSAGICNMSSYCNNAFDFHWHDGPELSVVIDGRMEYLVNDKRYQMEVGDCVFANSGAMHSGHTVDADGCHYLVVSFLTGAIDGAGEGFFAERFFGGVMDAQTVPSMFFEAKTGEVAKICVDIYEAIKKKDDGWELAVKGLLCHLWYLLYQEAKRQTTATPENAVPVARIKKAIRYMNDNYASKLSLEDIAAACNLSKSEFCRCFKRITRQTAFEYLMDLRIRKSIRLLDREGLSVTETALASGFSSSSYYTEVFRRYMGCTPREYMKRRKG